MKPTVDRDELKKFLARLAPSIAARGRVYLIGETSQLAEGWRGWSERIEIATDTDARSRDVAADAVGALSAEMGIEIVDESPGERIPLPLGYEERARPVSFDLGSLRVLHFDPYSVSFRYIARGDEPDYHLVLNFLRQGWITVEGMDAHLEELLPRFTERTIGQDSSEFRRKYHGLLQMWRAVPPGTVHRPTPV